MLNDQRCTSNNFIFVGIFNYCDVVVAAVFHFMECIYKKKRRRRSKYHKEWSLPNLFMCQLYKKKLRNDTNSNDDA